MFIALAPDLVKKVYLSPGGGLSRSIKGRY
jgi:hypothetical protein